MQGHHFTKITVREITNRSLILYLFIIIILALNIVSFSIVATSTPKQVPLVATFVVINIIIILAIMVRGV